MSRNKTNKKNQRRLARIQPDLDPNEPTSAIIYDCREKLRYESKRIAESYAGKGMRAYRCPHHGCYHLTSASRKTTKPRKRDIS